MHFLCLQRSLPSAAKGPERTFLREQLHRMQKPVIQSGSVCSGRAKLCPLAPQPPGSAGDEHRDNPRAALPFPGEPFPNPASGSPCSSTASACIYIPKRAELPAAPAQSRWRASAPAQHARPPLASPASETSLQKEPAPPRPSRCPNPPPSGPKARSTPHGTPGDGPPRCHPPWAGSSPRHPSRCLPAASRKGDPELSRFTSGAVPRRRGHFSPGMKTDTAGSQACSATPGSILDTEPGKGGSGSPKTAVCVGANPLLL